MTCSDVHFAKALPDFRALLLCSSAQTELEAAQNVPNHRVWSILPLSLEGNTDGLQEAIKALFSPRKTILVEGTRDKEDCSDWKLFGVSPLILY